MGIVGGYGLPDGVVGSVPIPVGKRSVLPVLFDHSPFEFHGLDGSLKNKHV